jgi:CRISPR system Cascade subunit CasC
MPNVELHILQNFPPANLNRDDTGTPKDCEFGGVRRARISSQCIKRSIRTSQTFEKALDARIGIRTKRAAGRVAEILQDEHGLEKDEANLLARSALDELASLSNEEETKVLYYAAPKELRDLAATLANAGVDLEALADKTKAQRKKAVRGAVNEFVDTHRGWARSVDIALFGRMLAEKPEMNLEAACQVAHAISTNRVSMEFDFYTAVDDLKQDEETGAGMMGTTGYNSSCFYRYMLVDVDHLARNLSPDEEATTASQELAKDGVEAFTRAAVSAIPTGMQTSFAAQTPPQFVLAVVRPDDSMPMSLVNAFELPAQPHNGTSLVADSIQKIDKHWKALANMYPDQNGDAYACLLQGTGSLDALDDARVDSVNDVIGGVRSSLQNAS